MYSLLQADHAYDRVSVRIFALLMSWYSIRAYLLCLFTSSLSDLVLKGKAQSYDKIVNLYKHFIQYTYLTLSITKSPQQNGQGYPVTATVQKTNRSLLSDLTNNGLCSTSFSLVLHIYTHLWGAVQADYSALLYPSWTSLPARESDS